ncbi:MAG: nucleotidyltransferase family protein [Thermodesulfobacteriota bacterium]
MDKIRYLRWLCLTALLDSDNTDEPPGTMPLTDELVHYACRHGLAPLLWRRLLKLDPRHPDLRLMTEAVTDDGLPPVSRKPLSSLLRESYLSTLLRNLQIQKTLRELDDALQQTGIPCLVWKGAAISAMVYGGMGLRPMDDIDLLVPEIHWQALIPVLNQIGFSRRPDYPLTWHRGPMVIDLHGDITHSDRIPARRKALALNTGTLLSRAAAFPGYSHLVMPSPFDALLCLAANAMKHGFSKDIWIVDMFLLFDRFPELSSSPRRLAADAGEAGASLPLFLLFKCAESWPRRLNPDPIGELEISRRAAAFSRFVSRAGLRLPNEGELYYLLMMKSPRDLMAYLRDTFFPSRQVMKQLYPGKPMGCYWLYYPNRHMRLAIKLFQGLASMVPGGRQR